MRIEKGDGYARKVTGVRVVKDRGAEKRAVDTYAKEKEAFRRYLDRVKRS